MAFTHIKIVEIRSLLRQGSEYVSGPTRPNPNKMVRIRPKMSGSSRIRIDNTVSNDIVLKWGMWFLIWQGNWVRQTEDAAVPGSNSASLTVSWTGPRNMTVYLKHISGCVPARERKKKNGTKFCSIILLNTAPVPVFYLIPVTKSIPCSW
jgi:hypothetical protein